MSIGTFLKGLFQAKELDVMALADMCSDHDWSRFRKALGHPNPETRKLALIWMGAAMEEVRSDVADGILRNALNDKDPGVRAAAEVVLQDVSSGAAGALADVTGAMRVSVNGVELKDLGKVAKFRAQNVHRLSQLVLTAGNNAKASGPPAPSTRSSMNC